MRSSTLPNWPKVWSRRWVMSLRSTSPLCPPFVYLSLVADAIAGTPVGLGAQNLYAADDGAYTGEINAGMLSDVGCRYVILGHSERRALMGETDQQVSEKLHRAMAGNLIPIVCVGETLEDREADRTEKVVGTQVRGSLAGLDEVACRVDRAGLRAGLGNRNRKDGNPRASRGSARVHSSAAGRTVYA